MERGRRTVAQQHRGGKRVQTVSRRREERPSSPKERRLTWQILICGGIFVALVAAKILFPQTMETLSGKGVALLERNMDIEAVFSALGRGFSENDESVAREVYRAVFGAAEPQEMNTVLLGQPSLALEQLHVSLREREVPAEEPLSIEPPPSVGMQQALLNFNFCTPVVGKLTSPFGYREHPVAGETAFHYGVDLAAAKGTQILAFADGTVGVVGESSSYGKYCTVHHAGGFSTLYAHCSRILAVSGASVSMGEAIAEVGSTGMATGDHLHFELQWEGEYLNPIYYLSLAREM